MYIKKNYFSADTHISIGSTKSFKHKITIKEIYVTKRKGLSSKYNVPKHGHPGWVSIMVYMGAAMT